MKFILFLLYILLISATYAKTARVAVSFNAPVWCGKNPYSPPPTCILRIESAEEVFPYSDSEKLANTIFRKMDVGQIAALSLWGYSSCDQSIGLLARLNLGKVFAYPEKMRFRYIRLS